MTPASAFSRRNFLTKTALAGAATALPALSFAQASAPARQFAPQSGAWRTFDVTTRIDIARADGATRVWVPLPGLNTDWQKSQDSRYTSNAKSEMLMEGKDGASLLYAEFAAGQTDLRIEVTSRVQTQNRSVDWTRQNAPAEDAATLAYWTQATEMLPTDGIVLRTAQEAVGNARTDVQKAQAIYDWIVVNTFRDPKVRGCGPGDIKSMLDTGNLSGKCADLNALFVGLCRAAGLPARDVYGVRLAPSAFAYKELGANSASLKGAQHCRAEVYLQGYGWVAMDPADVTKVMRQETPEWLRSAKHSVVAPVNTALFGGWEGNWMAYNVAHDVVLPHSKGDKVAFLMYPMAENAGGRFDPYAPDDFKYQISAQEIRA